MYNFQRALFLLDFTCPEKKSYKAVPHQKFQTFTVSHYFTKSAKGPGAAPDEPPRMIPELLLSSILCSLCMKYS